MSTPMMQQYQEIKAQVPDAILFFRLGDFYEMFSDDAELAAPILEIVLTGRDAGGAERVPMCGIPYHAADHYLAKLIAAGHKVAICEQVEDPRLAKGIVKREIIRIVSPGTLTDGLPTERDNNFLASIYYSEQWGLAFLDVSTGEFTIFQTRLLDTLQAELAKVRPAELLLPLELKHSTKLWQNYFCTTRNRQSFQALEALNERFPAQSTLLTELTVAAQAASALWQYFLESMPGVEPTHILEIKAYNQEVWMLLDPWTRRNLELTESLRGQGKKGTLLSVLDLTKTAGGGRLIRRWIEQPLLSSAEIKQRLDALEELTENGFLRSDLQKILTGVYDLERLMSKVCYGNANARDLLALASTLNIIPKIRDLLLNNHKGLLPDFIEGSEGLLLLTSKLESALNPEAPVGLKEGNLIKAGYSSEIDHLRSVASGGKGWVAALETSERERTGIRSLKVGYNKVFGYYIEATHANAHLIPADYQRKQTLANAERFVTPELKEYEQKILSAETRLTELEYQILLDLREEARRYTREILAVAKELAETDVLVSLSEVAVQQNYKRPEINLDGEIHIMEGRHPVVEQMFGAGGFVPNDTALTKENYLAMITGPNMAGKSTYMRQVALIVLMAHIGSFVPAQKASIGLVDRIFTRVGASDDLAAGQSTFMVEMQEVAHILRKATPQSLVVLDEVGRGTATFDGLSIAWAVVEYLLDNPSLRPKTLFATHYHELTQLENYPGAFNLHVSVREHGEDIVFLHKILPGRADRSYGIQVARLAGVPKDLLLRAKILLHELETSSTYNLALSQPNVNTHVLFAAPEMNPLLQEIAGLEIENMSPRQALEYLFDIRDRVHSLEAI
ncbi:MAG: DNA mismatch repair protein MutS [Desulfitobacteriaceae bacterium]